MKTVSVVSLAIVSILLSGLAQATEYACYSNKGDRATLSLPSGGSVVQWSDVSTSANSPGIFSYVETTPYAPTKGFFIYSLVDFFKTLDSQFRLALSPNVRNGKSTIIAIEYFDHDDHAESATQYFCKRYK